MREKKYYIALDGYERGIIVNALNESLERTLQQGRYTDAVGRDSIKKSSMLKLRNLRLLIRRRDYGKVIV